MKGTVINNNIFVDVWDVHEATECYHFLSSIFPNMSSILNSEWKCPIYSSELNITFLLRFTNVDSKLLKPLEFNKKTVLCKTNLTVTAINSKSFTGHVIYHFFCSGLNYLYLGNTCLTSSIFINEYLLSENKITFDAIYLDTSILRVPVDFSVKSATAEIVTLLKDKSIVIAMRPLGMEDLLVKLALQGYTVHVGPRRLRFLELQGADINFTISKNAMIRVVDKEHCEDIERCYKRFKEKKIITVIPSAFFSLEEIDNLKKVGIHIVIYSDNVTSNNLINFLKVVKTKNLISCNNENKLEILNTLNNYLKPHNVENILLSTISSSFKEFQDRERLDHSLAVHGSQNSDSLFQNLSISPDLFYPEKNSTNILAKNKNVDHLYTDTQVSFIPLATSTQRPAELSQESIISTMQNNEMPSGKTTKSKINQNIYNSQINMNRFVEELVNDESIRKNKLNRLHLVNIFHGNSMNRAASISKSKRLKEKCVQTDNLSEDNTSKQILDTQDNCMKEKSDIRENKRHNTDSDLSIISATDDDFMSLNNSIISHMSFEPIEWNDVSEIINTLKTTETLTSCSTKEIAPVNTENTQIGNTKNKKIKSTLGSQESYFTSLSQINDSFVTIDSDISINTDLQEESDSISQDIETYKHPISNSSSLCSSESPCLSDVSMLSDDL